MFGVVSCKSQEITSNPLKTERYKTGTFVALQDKIKKGLTSLTVKLLYSLLKQRHTTH